MAPEEHGPLVLGLDVEWPPAEAGGPPRPALLQLSTEGCCVLLRLRELEAEAGGGLPAALAALLADARVLNVRVPMMTCLAPPYRLHTAY